MDQNIRDKNIFGKKQLYENIDFLKYLKEKKMKGFSINAECFDQGPRISL